MEQLTHFNMYINMTVFVCITTLYLFSTSFAKFDEKRILSDPQYIQQQLDRFQSELQQQQVNYQSEIQSLKNTITQLQSTQGNEGAVFTRWGRKDCPANVTTMVYTGYAGGSAYTSTGAAAEYICLPKDPVWGPHKDLRLVHGTSDIVGYVYGAEYENPPALFGMGDFSHDVPCAVCIGTHHSVSLMIPGRAQCYPGWTEAYHGDLASGYYYHVAATEYVCVDQQPQSLEGGANTNENGKLFYGVKSKCGPLHCPPYEDKFLSCVVCLK